MKIDFSPKYNQLNNKKVEKDEIPFNIKDKVEIKGNSNEVLSPLKFPCQPPVNSKFKRLLRKAIIVSELLAISVFSLGGACGTAFATTTGPSMESLKPENEIVYTLSDASQIRHGENSAVLFQMQSPSSPVIVTQDKAILVSPSSEVKTEKNPVLLAEKYLGERSYDLKGTLPNFERAGGLTNNCADFVSAILQNSERLKGHAINVTALEKMLIKEGYKKVSPKDAQPGDVWFSKGRGHTELVRSNENGKLQLIGSNGQDVQYITSNTVYGGVIYGRREYFPESHKRNKNR